MFKPVLLVPIYNHLAQCRNFAVHLCESGVPVLVVDDGSNDTDELELFCRENDFLYFRHEKNFGKGSAIKSGLLRAREHGFTHALQIDADGQHEPADIPKFLAEARAFPESLVNGVPVYDADAPRSRTQGRKITNFWVALETRPRAIGDAMCGFRVYPLREMAPVLPKLTCARMGGDIEIIVHAFWAGVPVRNLPTRVRYPKDGVSHFHVFSDNVRLSLLHTRLFCLSLFRIFRKTTK